MAKVTDNSIEIGIPFAIPSIGIHEPVTLSINKAYFQVCVRVIVGICAFLLFWPKIKAAFGFTSPAVMEAQTQEIQERIAKMEHERDERQTKQNYAVATAPSVTSTTPTSAKAGKETGSAKRRKA